MWIVLLYAAGVWILYQGSKLLKKSWLAYCLLGIELTLVGGTWIIAFKGDNLGSAFLIMGLMLVNCGFIKNGKEE